MLLGFTVLLLAVLTSLTVWTEAEKTKSAVEMLIFVFGMAAGAFLQHISCTKGE
jgi:hypothetical protein